MTARWLRHTGKPIWGLKRGGKDGLTGSLYALGPLAQLQEDLFALQIGFAFVALK